MRLLTRYLFKEIFHYFLVFFGIAVIILMVQEVYDTRSEFMEKNPALLDVLKFILFSLPSKLVLILPLIGLVSTMFSFGLLAKNREVLAMVAAGVSFKRLSIPPLVFGVALVALMLFTAEVVVPWAEPRAKTLEAVNIKGKKESVFTKRNDLYVKGKGNRFYFMERYLPTTREMLFPTILEVNDKNGGVAERIEAEHAVLVADAGGKGNRWEFSGAERWLFDDKGLVRAYEKFKGSFQIKMEDDLDKFLSRSKDPVEMNFLELKAYRSLLARKGGENLDKLSLSMQHKLAFPLACALMAFLGFCVVVDVHARHFARGVFLGLLVAIGFYIIDALLTNIGNQGLINALPAVWLPIMLFIIVDYVLLKRLNQVRR